MRFPSRRPVRWATVLLMASACGGGGGGTEPPVRAPAAVVSLSTQPGGATSGAPFTTQPVVALRTAAGEVAVQSNATVSVVLSGGAGTLTGTTSVAAVEGVARFTNLAVSAAGSYTLTFSSPGLTPATAGPLTVAPVFGPPATLTFEPEFTILQVGQSAGMRAMVRDAAGNLLNTPPLTWEARDPAIATIDANGTVTTAARGQAIVIARTAAAPILADSMLIAVVSPAGTVLRSSLTAFTIKTDTTLSISVYVDMRSTAKRLSSGLIDVAYNPAQLSYQSSTQGAVGSAIGTADQSSGKLHISYADPNGIGGTVEIVRLTFKAASSPGISGRFTLTSSEATTSDFTDLLPNMLQVSQPVVLR